MSPCLPFDYSKCCSYDTGYSSQTRNQITKNVSIYHSGVVEQLHKDAILEACASRQPLLTVLAAVALPLCPSDVTLVPYSYPLTGLPFLPCHSEPL